MSARLCVAAGLLFFVAGCGPLFGAKAINGITFYCPGAGNIDFGDVGVRQGLEAAGYRGQVATFTWTIAPLNPAIDQTLRVNAKLRAGILSDYIEEYADKYPGRPVNLVGLSAGTGVAVWALEGLRAKYKVDNVVLLGSSLWFRYDMTEALKHVRGKVYVYYSPHDAVLAGPMKVFGTIDGKFGEDGAGAVGLRPPRGAGDRIVNVPYRSEFQRYGYYGGHVDSTSPAFVRNVLARHILSEAKTAQADTDSATPAQPVLQAGTRD